MKITDMNTITLTQEMYNDIKVYADEKKVSVQDFVVTLIARLYPHKPSVSEKKYKMKKTEELSPVLQKILAMPKTKQLTDNDIESAREAYYKEKYEL